MGNEIEAGDVEAWIRAVADGGDDGAVKRLIMNVAERTCTRKQTAALAAYLDGKSTAEIGRAMGVGQSTAHTTLFGHHTHGGGVVARLREALKGESTAIQEALMQRERKQDDGPKEDVVSWFSGLTPSRIGLFGPLSVLLVAHFLADAKRSTTIADLCLYVPKQAVHGALTPLKHAGYIATDGVAITIRKTPLDEMKERAQ
jgi:hypothetical protein